MTQLVTRGGLGLGASLDESVPTWIDAVRRHLDDRGSSLLSREAVRSYIGPKTYVPVRPAQLRDAAGRVVTRAAARGRARALTPAERRRPLEVVPDGDFYRVSADPAEYRRFMAHLAAETDPVWCAVPNPNATGDVVVTVIDEIDRLDVASADLCLQKENEAIAARAAASVTEADPPERPRSFQMDDCDLTTSAGRRQAVEAFLDESRALAHAPIRLRHIWQSMGYTSRRTFGHWLEASSSASVAIDRNVRRVLGEGPAVFVARLRRGGHL